MSKHVWTNKRTPKGTKPVREWLECENCGAVRDGQNVAPIQECKQ